MVGQYLTEGSLISVQGAEDLDSMLVNLDHAEPEYANHFLFTANIDEERVPGAHRARAQLVEAPVHNRYMLNLEVANSELRRRNNELARKMIGGAAGAEARAGSAAPAFVVSFENRIVALEAMLEAMAERQRAEIGQRDDMILAQRRELLEIRQQLLTPPVATPTVRERIRHRLRG